MVAAIIMEIELILNWLILVVGVVLSYDVWKRRGKDGWRRRDDDY
jgi:hypothetical protein|tara:strand:- start:4761 stop:4895 length:135 start_codon:yes stop_codon:yes gene_type:complete